MIKILKPKSYCGIGTNFKTMLPLVKKFFNRYTGYIKHYYLINKNIKKYQLAQIKKKIKLKNNNIFYKDNIEFNEIFDFNDLEKKFIFKKFKFLPYKSKCYIRKRYFEHPIYKYRFFSVKNKNTKIISLLILRNFTYDKIKIIRIVDFIGEINDLHIIYNISKSLFQKENLEYIDFYAARLPKKIQQNIKFNIIKNNDKNIIPDYFEPFENKNQKIFYETSNNKMILFKADADQDRPRIK